MAHFIVIVPLLYCFVLVPILYCIVLVTIQELSTLLEHAKILADTTALIPVSIPGYQYQHGVSVAIPGLSTVLVLVQKYMPIPPH